MNGFPQPINIFCAIYRKAKSFADCLPFQLLTRHFPAVSVGSHVSDCLCIVQGRAVVLGVSWAHPCPVVLEQPLDSSQGLEGYL